MKKNTFTMLDDKGQEHTYDVLFTFESEENGNNYIVYTDNSLDENGNIVVFASTYDPTNPQSRLGAVETEQEWKVIETILETLQEEVRNKMNGENNGQ